MFRSEQSEKPSKKDKLKLQSAEDFNEPCPSSESLDSTEIAITSTTSAKASGELTPTHSPARNDENPKISPTQLRSPSAVSESPPKSPVKSSCPVCLGTIENLSFTDSCPHEFCFNCLVQWSKVKPECPLCKKTFRTIMYNVKSADEFSEMSVAEVNPNPAVNIFTDLLDSRRLFRYPTTLATPADYNRRSANRDVAMFRRRLQQMVEDMRRRQIEGLRHRVYRNRLKTVVANNGRVREATPAFFKRHPTAIHRLVPFLTRELRVLFEADNREVTRIINIINSLLPRYPIMSERFIELLRPSLGSRTRRFCQELLTFARCPFDLAGYDRHAIYESDSPPIDVDAVGDPPNMTELLSSPEFNPNQGARPYLTFPIQENGPSSSATLRRMGMLDSTNNYSIEISSDSESDNGDWIPVSSSINASGINDAENSFDSNDSDCQIVKFDKPWEERSPVSLSSAESSDLEVFSPPPEKRICNNSTRSKEESATEADNGGDDNYVKESTPESSTGSLSPIAARGKRWTDRAIPQNSRFPTSFFLSMLTDTNSANSSQVGDYSEENKANEETQGNSAEKQ